MEVIKLGQSPCRFQRLRAPAGNADSQQVPTASYTGIFPNEGCHAAAGFAETSVASLGKAVWAQPERASGHALSGRSSRVPKTCTCSVQLGVLELRKSLRTRSDFRDAQGAQAPRVSS